MKNSFPRPLSLCEFLSERGGIRLSRSGRATIGAGCLRSMEAQRWHRARPFRKMLVRDHQGMTPDYAALVAWEAGYFGEACDRPDVADLLALIERELSGEPVYRLEDWYALESEAAAMIADCDYAQDYGYGATDCATAGVKVELYEQSYVNRRGRPGVSYLAKVLRDDKPVFHKSFFNESERDAAVRGVMGNV